MDVTSLLQAGALVGIAFVTATAALLAGKALFERRETARWQRDAPDVAFLFDGEALIDATAAGRRLLSYAATPGNDMARLVSFLTPRFPDLHERLATCGEEDRLLLLSADCRSRLRLESGRGKLRIALEDVDDSDADPPDRHSQALLSAELEAHRAASDASPVPIWRADAEGRVVWANGAYWALATATGDLDVTAPGRIPTPFPDPAQLGIGAKGAQRIQVELAGGGVRWFEVTGKPVGEDVVFSAVPADATLAAERTLREFMQTLTQTFAHLSIGLAIFDRKRELSLFNPALGDLLGLQVEFLVGRPSLIRFLDHLRERQMMPEPKDYKTWRQKMSELEAAAAEGGHSETWPLPDGRTFRITGRPHPDGAVAFLFEDISAEISLSREYRKELEIGQAVMDLVDEAIAVFSADGRLSFCNRSYTALWHDGDEAATQATRTFLDASRIWQMASMPTPVWGDAREFADEMSGRTAWAAEVRLTNGRQLDCRFEPLPGGSTMVGFSRVEASAFETSRGGQSDTVLEARA